MRRTYCRCHLAKIRTVCLASQLSLWALAFAALLVGSAGNALAEETLDL